MPAGNRGKVSRGWVRSVEPRKLAVRVDCGALCAPAAGLGACTRHPRAPESAGRKAPAAAVRPGKSSEARLKAAAGVGVAGSGPSSSRPVSKRSRCSAGARAGLFGTPSRTASSVPAPAAESGAGRQRAGVEEHLGVARESLVSAPGFRGRHPRGRWKVCRQHRERAHAEKAPGAIRGKLALPGALAGVGRARGLGTTALAWQPLQGIPCWGCEATQVSS